jgi:hypothetical protein
MARPLLLSLSLLLACSASAKRDLSQYIDLTGTPAAPRAARVMRPAPSAEVSSSQVAEDVTSPTAGGELPQHIGHALRAPSYEGVYGLAAARNLSHWRSELFGKLAPLFLPKAAKVEDDDEKYSRYKMYAPFITCPPGGCHRGIRIAAACSGGRARIGRSAASPGVIPAPAPRPARPLRPP